MEPKSGFKFGIQQANVNLETSHELISRVQPVLSLHTQLMIEHHFKILAPGYDRLMKTVTQSKQEF